MKDSAGPVVLLPGHADHGVGGGLLDELMTNPLARVGEVNRLKCDQSRQEGGKSSQGYERWKLNAGRDCSNEQERADQALPVERMDVSPTEGDMREEIESGPA